MRVRPLLAGLGIALVALALAHPALAQAHNPFGVGISEGGGSASGITGWIIQRQIVFERQLSAAVRAARTDGSAVLLLAGLSFAYGVFHAAGPGHGKAVITSYLFANERTLRRGLILSLLAALLQGIVAILLVGVLALVLHATAQRMKDAATLVETLSYAGIALLGAWLVWRKGRVFLAALAEAPLGGLRFASASGSTVAIPRSTAMIALPAAEPLPALPPPMSTDPLAAMSTRPIPLRSAEGFSWREALVTVVAAGSRALLRAILVLVFALAQGVFVTGVVAVLAMAFGVAITTGALACVAVLARSLAMRLVPPERRSGILVLRGLEVAAAALVLAAGLSLLMGAAGTGGA